MSAAGTRWAIRLQKERTTKVTTTSIANQKNPWHWLSISGRVVDIRPDENLAFIDRLAHRTWGRTTPRRTPREIFTIAVHRASPTRVRG